jgi:hypothetical protein
MAHIYTTRYFSFEIVAHYRPCHPHASAIVTTSQYWIRHAKVRKTLACDATTRHFMPRKHHQIATMHTAHNTYPNANNQDHMIVSGN